MTLFDTITDLGGRIQGEAVAYGLATQRVLTGQVRPTQGWQEFQRLRPMGRNVGVALTRGAVAELDDPQNVPRFAVQVPRLVRGGVNLGGAALDTVGALGQSANTLADAASKFNDANDATRGWLVPVALAGGAYLLLRR